MVIFGDKFHQETKRAGTTKLNNLSTFYILLSTFLPTRGVQPENVYLCDLENQSTIIDYETFINQ